MQLSQALDFHPGDMAALIGAGGKTTTMFRLAKELRDQGRKVLVTTTTKIFKPSKPHVDRLFLVEDSAALSEACAAIAPPAIIGAGVAIIEEGKLVGLPCAWFDALKESKQFDAILIEADGAAARLFKVPGESEPVIPANCQLTIWLMAITVLNRPLDAAWIHRAERAAALLALPRQQRITEDIIVQLVQHPAGCWKGIPPASRRVAVINQADNPQTVVEARSLGEKLLRCGIERVVITSYADNEPVKEVLLQ